MPAAPPTAPPRKRKPITKKDISEPYDFVHCAHVGLDFNSEDVKNAIKPNPTGRQASTDHVYESVNRQETPILIPSSGQEELSLPPIIFAPEYISNRDSGPSTASVNPVLIPPAKPSKTKEEVLNYENRPSTHIYQNINNGSQQPRPSKKKNPPPPPPPQTDKIKLEPDEPSVAFRKISNSAKETIVEEIPKIETPKRIEAAPASIIVERPGLLGEMRLGLDDPIPLTTGLPSKYRSPSMLTPKEMAVDVPTPMRTPEKDLKKEEVTPRKSRLIKESAVDVPSTPSVTSEQSKMIIPESLIEPKRIAPPPPEPAEAPRAAPYVPMSAAHSSTQLKNVIYELKTKQSKEDTVEEVDEEEEGNEYVSISQKGMKKPIPVVQKTDEKKEEKTEDIPAPVPKPRRTVVASVDAVEEEKTTEKSLEDEDDGISTGCSDEDKVIRL